MPTGSSLVHCRAMAATRDWRQGDWAGGREGPQEGDWEIFRFRLWLAKECLW